MAMTVNSVEEVIAVGVPAIAPVDALNDNPVGSAPGKIA